MYCSLTKRDAVEYDRLRPRCRHLANGRKPTRRLWFWPIPCIIWNMTSHPQNRKYITYRTYRQRRSEPRPQVTWAENLAKFGRVVFKICERTQMQIDKQTNRQTDALIAIFHTHAPLPLTKWQSGLEFRSWWSGWSCSSRVIVLCRGVRQSGHEAGRLSVSVWKDFAIKPLVQQRPQVTLQGIFTPHTFSGITAADGTAHMNNGTLS